MSFLCTTINKKVSHHQCVNECQYIFKNACIDKMNEAYNQALEDFFNKCKELSYKESLETDSSVEFDIVELDDIKEVLEQLKEHK